MARKSSPKLALIAASEPVTGLQPPAHLGEVARQLWCDVTGSYEFGDPASLQVLAEACSALDRSERCRAQISADGEVIRTGRGGMLRAHPLLAPEVQARALACRLLQRLGLDLEPTRDGRGRPPGGAVGISWRDLPR
jgi:phage terminase small subunit